MFASKVLFAWMVITAIAISGCSSNQVKAKLSPSRQTTQAAEPTLTLNPAPKAIMDVGEYAENAYDAALAGNWTRVAAKVQSLRASAAKLEKGGQSSGQNDIETSISELEQSAAIHNKIRTMKVANEITRLAAEMSSHYRLVVPVQVVLLDYDGRELQIDSMDGDLAGARRMASKIQSDWNLVRPKVQAQGGDGASRFNRLVDQIQNAKTKETFAQLANQELNAVDFLEHLFEK